MGFKISRNPTYKTEIAVSMPNLKGKRDVEKFTAEFKLVGLERLEELRGMKHSEVLAEVLVGWEGMLDDANEEVPFNATNKAIVFDIPQAFEALVQGFWSSIFGAKKGN